jgi:hypothetical protein
LLAAFALVSCLADFSSVKMEVICSSETSVDFQWTTWRCIPEDKTLEEYTACVFRVEVSLVGKMTGYTEINRGG